MATESRAQPEDGALEDEEFGVTTCKICEHWPEQHIRYKGLICLCEPCQLDFRPNAQHDYQPGGARSTQ